MLLFSSVFFFLRFFKSAQDIPPVSNLFVSESVFTASDACSLKVQMCRECAVIALMDKTNRQPPIKSSSLPAWRSHDAMQEQKLYVSPNFSVDCKFNLSAMEGPFGPLGQPACFGAGCYIKRIPWGTPDTPFLPKMRGLKKILCFGGGPH